MKKVLLTGATGFIGGHCLPLLLEKGYEVHAVSSKQVDKILSEGNWHQANLLKSSQVYELMAKVQPSHLLHFAWYAVPGKYWTSLENFRWVQGSLDLLSAFVQHGGKRVVMAGTCAEYNWNYGYCSEAVTPLSPATVYGTCKHSLQMMLDAFVQQTRLSAAWGRIFFVYGPHEHPSRLVSSVIHSLIKGEPALCSHGNQIRDFLYVEDVADAFVALLESDVAGALNIASGEPVALKDIIYKVATQFNRTELIQLGAIPSSSNDPPFLVANVERLKDEVNWRLKYNSSRGLEQTIKWWKKNYDTKTSMSSM
ncbi:NAD-dependent epimerase/dehydratase family protein [Microcoleus sp. FACHB-672]|uniref:NAD-dependent epimerase/dehydratase family protein n=1 Tax=Microcoleus sp. FACHB-672 TaxID=2692825 RepID=UPI001685009F|nr:NAD(P)-dependent oxidoreductase [Microcoleus sp. FACHB-672]MBD2040338.1 NAD(P)-dependent oxidoreductase [Microcoleus sp. FACHB-672]